METLNAADRVRTVLRRCELAPGLALVPLEAAHADQFSGLVEANREHLGPWMNWVWKPFPVDAARSEIERMAPREPGPWSMPFAIERDGRMVGFAQLFGIRFFVGTAEVSYWIDRHEVGRGITSRAVGQLCRLAFEELGLHRIELRCADGNLASRAVARRCGFVQEGLLRGAWRVQDQRQNLVVHARLSTDQPWST